MKKDEKLELVNENGETILMTQSEYLGLAKQKGWNTKIHQHLWHSFSWRICNHKEYLC